MFHLNGYAETLEYHTTDLPGGTTIGSNSSVRSTDGNSGCVATVQRMSQETSLANNAEVLDVCQTQGGDCSNAIAKAQQDRADLENYRDALTVQKNEAADTASKTAVMGQIR